MGLLPPRPRHGGWRVRSPAAPYRACGGRWRGFRFLYLHDIPFKFVTPTGIKGKDYDFAIEYVDGRSACADAKCRLEGTAIRAETVKNSLNKARSNNLPPDEPGIVFVKVPQNWLEQEHMRKGLYTAVGEFLRKTERIVSVVVYTTVTVELPDKKMMLLRHRFHEFLNPSHRFDRTKDWALFKNYKVPEEWGGAHPKWVRVFSQGFFMREGSNVPPRRALHRADVNSPRLP